MRPTCDGGVEQVGDAWDVCGEVLIEDGRRGYINGEVISEGGALSFPGRSRANIGQSGDIDVKNGDIDVKRGYYSHVNRPTDVCGEDGERGGQSEKLYQRGGYF